MTHASMMLLGVKYLQIYVVADSPHFFDVQIEVDVGVNEPHQLADFLRCEVWIFKTEKVLPFPCGKFTCDVLRLVRGQTPL